MPQPALTGSRIRERRLLRGMRQSALARAVGISASYLNLIEHNRRRIGGKLLVDIAAALDADPSLLAEGAEAALVSRLRAAAGESGADEGVETDQAEALAGRYPGWARLVVAQRRRIAALERAVEVLTDRLTHDPHLAATLHEVLDTASAIRSTAAILAGTDAIEPEWRDRFHRNIDEDAARLAEGARALAGYLDGAGDAGRPLTLPQEEVARFWAAHDHHMPALERAGETEGETAGEAAGERAGERAAASPEEIAAAAPELASQSGRALGLATLRRYQADAGAMPLGAVTEAITELGTDPLALAERFGVDVATAMRRIASLPESEAGLVICDNSGTLTHRKPVPSFALPRFGAACPLWPLFRALSRPMVPIFERIRQPGRDDTAFAAWAVALPAGAAALGREPVYEAHMLLVPGRHDAEAAPMTVGAGCRICAEPGCAARREPSIMGEGQ